MMFNNIQFNPAVAPQSYTQDAKHIALRSGTAKDKAVNQPQDASQTLVSGTVRSKAPLRLDKFQHTTTTSSSSARMREGSSVSGFKSRPSEEERYGFVEGMMVNCGAMMNRLLP
jgi:hypothetical protein